MRERGDIHMRQRRLLSTMLQGSRSVAGMCGWRRGKGGRSLTQGGGGGVGVGVVVDVGEGGAHGV